MNIEGKASPGIHSVDGRGGKGIRARALRRTLVSPLPAGH